MKKRQSEGSNSMSADELSEAVKRLKDEGEARIQEMLKSVGVSQDKKHRKMHEKIAERKAKQIARIAALKNKKAEVEASFDSQAAVADVEAEISREMNEAAKDIADLKHGLAERHEKTQSKTHNRVLKLIDLSVLHNSKLAEHSTLEEKQRVLSERAAAIERAHHEESARMNARQALEKEQATAKLNSRLELRRKKKLEALRHDANGRKKVSVAFLVFCLFDPLPPLSRLSLITHSFSTSSKIVQYKSVERRCETNEKDTGTKEEIN